ncbi:MAG TPA: hypothetical protein VNN06_09750 [Ramlibacter sp.]|nr:hypothetical protein [Ramlibacter sp.]
MCYLIREHSAGAAERGAAALPPSLERMRPRWIGAVAAALIGGVAVAALVAQPSVSPSLSVKESAPPAAALASQAMAEPTAAGPVSAPVDDGVSSAMEVVKAGMGQCEHGL